MPNHTPLLSALISLVPPPILLSATKRASVALILRPPSTTKPLHVLFIQRSPRSSDPWSAHIAFPGGKRHPSDPDDFTTAVREVREEIGLDLLSPSFAFVARLNDRPIYRTNPGRAVLSAFVFLQLAPSYSIVLQPSEIASCFWIPFHYLHTDSPIFSTHPLVIPNRTDTFVSSLISKVRQFFGLSLLHMPALDVLPLAEDLVAAVDAPHTLLWGLTLGILGDFVDNLGFTRVDTPSLLPDNSILAAVLQSIAQCRRFLKQLFWYRERKLDHLLSEGVAVSI